MNVVYLGSGEFGLKCLEALSASRHELVLVVTQPPRGAGRGRRPCATAVAHWAQVQAVPYVETDDVNATSVLDHIAACEPDVMVVIACGQKIGAELIALPSKGAVNVHASLLPKYRGAAPINWAILRGETHTGNTIITLADRIDAGDIVAQCETPIGVHETAGELHDRLAQLAAPLLIETLDKIEAGTATYTRQDEFQATRAPKLRKSDGFLDFDQPAYVLADTIRGLWPWPGASACYLPAEAPKSTRVTLALAEIVWDSGEPQAAPGTFDEDLNVICGNGRLSIMKIKPAGSGLMAFKDFINGWRVCPGDRLVKVDS